MGKKIVLAIMPIFKRIKVELTATDYTDEDGCEISATCDCFNND